MELNYFAAMGPDQQVSALDDRAGLWARYQRLNHGRAS